MQPNIFSAVSASYMRFSMASLKDGKSKKFQGTDSLNSKINPDCLSGSRKFQPRSNDKNMQY
jgi:hypothetical protein